MLNKSFAAALTIALGTMLTAADAPAPILELKLKSGDFNTVKTSVAAIKVTAVNPANIVWSEGRLDGKAVEFKNPVDSKKRRGHAHFNLPKVNVDFTKPFTVSLWVKLDEKIRNNGPQYAIVSTAKGDYGPGFRLYYSWGTFRLLAGDGTAKGCKSIAVNKSKQPFDAKAWNHLAVSYDGAKVSLFINGTFASGVEVKIVRGFPNLNIGGYLNGYAYGFCGKMEDVKFFASALPPEQILALTQAE